MTGKHTGTGGRHTAGGVKRQQAMDAALKDAGKHTTPANTQTRAEASE